MTYEVTISRFELYPREEPDSWVVGFTVTWPGNRTRYVDTTVPLEKARGKSDEEIADLAWEMVRETVESWDRQYMGKSPLLGQRYIPKEKRNGDKGGGRGGGPPEQGPVPWEAIATAESSWEEEKKRRAGQEQGGGA